MPMLTPDDFKKQWGKNNPHERRQRLNELGAMPEKDDEHWNEHNALAELVANDEEAEAEAEKEEEE